MGPASMKRFQLFLKESTELFSQKTVTCSKKQHGPSTSWTDQLKKGSCKLALYKEDGTESEFEDEKNSSRSGKKTSLQRRLHFREDWVLWRTFLIGK